MLPCFLVSACALPLQAQAVGTVDAGIGGEGGARPRFTLVLV